MRSLGLERDVVDAAVRDRAVAACRDRGVLLPTFAELADPATIPESVRDRLAGVDPDAADPLYLFRVHWYNAADRRGSDPVPGFIELPRSLTGVEARIVVALGERFPMIGAHKVLAAYACLAPRIVTGQYDPTSQRALWPSTGNYCRGGIAISRVLGCRGVAILPEGMSRERFEWLDRWVEDPEDVVRTPGTESNVKEIYDACDELANDERNVIFNQFCEFGNHLAHRLVTGAAMRRIVEALRTATPDLVPVAFVSATGSAGTLAAGESIAEAYGTRVCAVEALECPTLLYNGFGEHNIQGIGDKHVPYIHNVMATDYVVGISDRATDGLLCAFGSRDGASWLADSLGIPDETIAAVAGLGPSGIANVLACIKLAKRLGLSRSDCLLTVATDSARLYASERERIAARDFEGRHGRTDAERVFAEHVTGLDDDHVLEATVKDRERIFNLGYFTWVEQRGVSVEDFIARKDQVFWRGLHDLPAAWDALIRDFNARCGADA